MPTLARIDGVKIKMFYSQTEHKPPHIHAEFGEFKILIDIKNEKILEGF